MEFTSLKHYIYFLLQIQYIQNNCEEAMQLWGYRKIENFTNFQQATFDPIELPPPFSWSALNTVEWMLQLCNEYTNLQQN